MLTDGEEHPPLMAWTQAHVETLKAAIASGQLSVRLDGRQITYQSTEAMLKALERMETEVAAAAGNGHSRTGRRFAFTTYRGW